LWHSVTCTLHPRVEMNSQFVVESSVSNWSRSLMRVAENVGSETCVQKRKSWEDVGIDDKGVILLTCQTSSLV
jgi:hypothetical protein